jgi:hypothetical protein
MNFNIKAKFFLMLIKFIINCSNGSIPYQQKCLKFYNISVTYPEAELICVVAMISIHSGEENKFTLDFA